MLGRAPIAAPPLIGRGCEAALLWSQFERAAEGRLGVALVAGDAGIGKTRLLDEIAARAAHAGATVLRGGASEAEGMPPYLPFLEALGRHIRAVAPEALREQIGPFGSILAAILPELPARLGELPPSYPLPADQARLRLYEAIGSFLGAVAAAGPLLLILDDLHWADPATLDLLCFVARHQRDAPSLILGAYREGEAAHPPAFERALTELHRLRTLTVISADPLSEGEIADLAHSHLGGPLDPRSARTLFRQSEGNPFFAEELLRAWVERGALVRVGAPLAGRAAWALIGNAEPELPRSIVGAVRQRLARLPDAVVEVLRVAAVVGRVFDIALVAEVAGREREPVEELLLEASRAHLVRVAGPAAFAFVHDTIRECLYADITSARRTRLHEHIGRSLEQRADRPDAQRLAELAFHFAHSGDHGRGVAYAQRAAESAMVAYAPDEAMAHYRAALALLDVADERRGAVLLGLGEAATLAGSEREAVDAFRTAEAWFRDVGDRESAARAAYGRGRAAWRVEDLAAASGAFEAALALLDGVPSPDPLPVRVLVDLGTLVGVTMHRYAEGLAHGREGLALARRLDDDRLIAAAYRAVGNLLVRANDLEAGIPLLERALAIAADADDPAEAAECCACLGLAYLWGGNVERLSEIGARRTAYARRCHDPHQLRHAYVSDAIVAMYSGHLAEAEALLADAEALVGRLADPEPLGYLRLCQGGLAYQQGDYARAEERFVEACAVFRAMGPAALVWFAGWPGLAQAHLGKEREAHASAIEAQALADALPPTCVPVMEALAPVAATAVALADRALAARLYPRLLHFRNRQSDFLIERLLGELALLLRDWPAAETHLAAAEAAAHQEDGAPRLGRGPELARTLAARADLELARGSKGNPAHARRLLERALELMRGLGMEGEARRIGERLGGFPHSYGAAAPTPVPLPDDLTPREAEVLRLIAAGRSNQEIAVALVLSVRTVERHISNIYAKINATGAAARAAAVAYALRHDLA